MSRAFAYMTTIGGRVYWFELTAKDDVDPATLVWVDLPRSELTEQEREESEDVMRPSLRKRVLASSFKQGELVMLKIVDPEKARTDEPWRLGEGDVVRALPFETGERERVLGRAYDSLALERARRAP